MSNATAKDGVGPKQADMKYIKRNDNKSRATWTVTIKLKHAPEDVRDTFDDLQKAISFRDRELARMLKLAAAEERRLKKLQAEDPKYFSYASQGIGDVLRRYVGTADAPGPATDRDCSFLGVVIDHAPNTAVGDIDDEWVAEFVRAMRARDSGPGRKYAYSTIKGQLVIMRKACKWWAKKCKSNGALPPFGTDSFEEGWEQSRQRRFKGDEERRLLERLGRVKSKAARSWQLLVLLCLETGARMQELIKAEWDEFDWTHEYWLIPARHVKTKLSRIVPMSSRCVEILEELWDLRSEENPRVFHRHGKTHSVSAAFRGYVKSAGIKDLTFHDLRHIALTRMACDMELALTDSQLMDISGHKSLSSLRVYINKSPVEAVQKFRLKREREHQLASQSRVGPNEPVDRRLPESWRAAEPVIRDRAEASNEALYT